MDIGIISFPTDNLSVIALFPYYFYYYPVPYCFRNVYKCITSSEEDLAVILLFFCLHYYYFYLHFSFQNYDECSMEYIYSSQTCCIYYPFNKHLLDHAGDALSNTSGLNFFWYSPSLLRFSFWRNSCIFHITIYTTNNLFQMDSVEDLNYIKWRKTHMCVVNNTATHVIYQGVNPDDAMKTKCFGCVSIGPYKNLSK